VFLLESKGDGRKQPVTAGVSLHRIQAGDHGLGSPFLLPTRTRSQLTITSGPAIGVVSEQSEKDILKKRAHDQLTRDLRKFAANFPRITSGSGKPLDLLRQTEKLRRFRLMRKLTMALSPVQKRSTKSSIVGRRSSNTGRGSRKLTSVKATMGGGWHRRQGRC
jgi:hypothetical protein